MGKKFFSALPNDMKANCREPTDEDFLSYVSSHWPTFNALPGPGKDLEWGWVEKGVQKTNEINILSDIVVSAEISAERVSTL
jgi:hypothetical protein